MHYEITVANGHFPLTYSCTTAHEAYGCIETLSTGLLHDISIDMDEIMDTLIRMKRGDLLSHSNSRYAIKFTNGEV